MSLIWCSGALVSTSKRQSGTFLTEGTFVRLPKLANEPFLKLWEQEVFKLLLLEGKITDEVVANIRNWRRPGFSVDQSVRVEAKDTEARQRLIQYFLRCPFSQARMIEVTAQGTVIYKSGNNRLGHFPQAASGDLLAGPKRNFQIFEALDFLAACPPVALAKPYPSRGSFMAKAEGDPTHTRSGGPPDSLLRLLLQQEPGTAREKPGSKRASRRPGFGVGA